MKLLAFFLAAVSAFAGQSVTFGQHLIYNNSIPVTTTNRVEFYIHDWTASTYIHILSSGSTGWLVYTIAFSPTNVVLVVYNTWDNDQGVQVPLSGLAQPAVYMRLQHNPATKVDLVEAWDINGNRIANDTLTYTSENDSGSNFQMGYGNEPSVSMGFMRVYSTLLPLNSRPPVTSDTSPRVLEWKFDGDLSDSSGHGHTAIYYGGTPVFSPTPYQNTVAQLRTSNANSWTSVVSQRAGYPTSLDGTASYSQADASASVSCFWQELSGPSAAQFDNRNSCTPVVTGLVFGDYLMQLTVVGASGVSATTSADIGAVAMDSKGVVVNADPNVDALFGNMIAFGQNPWGFADYWAQHAMTLRAADYASSGWTNQQWENTGAGTVSYYWNGVGYEPANTSLGTTLAQSVNASAGTLTVANAARLDLTDLPARVLLMPGNFPNAAEEVRICSVAGNVLTVCYDGRGQNAQSWSAGALVSEAKVTGAGTRFLTDTAAPVCPVGAPGPTGPAAFTAGSVTLTAGSAVMTGTGTNWPSTYGASNGTTAGYYVRVPATHSGIPFWFIAQNTTGGAIAAAYLSGSGIGSVTTQYGQSGQNYIPGAVNVVITDPTGVGAVVTANISGGVITSYTVTNAGANYTNPTVTIQPTSLTLNRPYPADADSATFTGYALLPGSRTIDLRGSHVYDTGSIGEALWDVTGCESETSLYLNPIAYGNEFGSGHDVPALDGKLESGYQYSVTDSTGWINESATGGISFYGESLASRALYYRSGLTAALNAANTLDDGLIRSPWGNHDVNGYPPLFTGGLAIGAFASGILTGRVHWGDLRSYSGYAESEVVALNNHGTPNCEYDDTRDTGYSYAWLTLGAIFDPDTSVGGFRSRWRNDLTMMQANDSVCKRSDSSWSNGFYWNTQIGPLTLTANSKSATGTGLAQSSCTGITSGTGSVTAGSATITVPAGTVPATGADALVITGTMGGNPFTGNYYYSGAGASATLSVLWPGDSGTVTWMAVNTQNSNSSMTAFATSNSDYTDLANNYACIWNSATSLTLDHPWKGATGGGYYGYMSNLAGYGQQPFMLGIKTYGMGLLAAAVDPALSASASAYAAFNAQATQWIHDYGVDANTLTTNYGRNFQFCEPSTTASSSAFDARSPGCNYGTSLNGETTGREQNQELGNAIADYYQNNPNSASRTWGDSMYGAVWGNAAYNTGGAFYDAASDATNINSATMLDNYIHGGKWYGFFAGMGMLHRWPAVRLGGVDPPNYKTVQVPFALSTVSGAAKLRLTVTEPSGASAAVVCTLSPCAITVDARSGSVLMEQDYLNSSGSVIAPGDQLPLYVPK